MIYIKIDAAKDRYDCFIFGSEGEVLAVANSMDGLLSCYKVFEIVSHLKAQDK